MTPLDDQMMLPSSQWWRGALAGLVAATLLSTPSFARLLDFPPAKSAVAVKELVGLLDAKQLTAFAAHDGDPYKFVAVMYVPGVQMFGVSARYDRPGDLDYFLDHKDFKSAYDYLRSSGDATDRFIVDDAECNGLVPQPKRSQPNDDAVFGTTRKTLDGVFVDPKHADPKHPDATKPSFDDYLKTFTDADEQYTHILAVLIEQLKKTAP
jgi:hypothetical protein